MHVLDQQNYIAQRDPQDALAFARSQPQQLRHNFKLTIQNSDVKITNVVFAGMGGSAIHAEFARTWPTLRVPIVLWKQYSLPAFADHSTLVVISSVSGNTEEALSALDEAEKRGTNIAVIAHGGKLAERARKSGYVFAQIPSALQPRMAVFYLFRALIEILGAYKLIDRTIISDLEETAALLEAIAVSWQPSVSLEQNIAKQLATHAAGKTSIIYAGPLMSPAAYKWKIDFNENAKNTAWCNSYPEVSHNEFIGWSSHPIQKPFAVFDLVSSFEDPRVHKRFALTDRLLSGKRPHALTVDAEGTSLLQHLLYLVLLGDYMTLYLAMLNGVNPVPVELVEKFKTELNA